MPFWIRLGLVVAALFALADRVQAADTDCPSGGTLRFAVVPAEDTAKLTPIYQHLGELIGAKLGCKVVVQFGTSYTAVIEALRAHQAEMAQFGAFSYVLAHQMADAEAVAVYAGPDGKPGSYYATISTWPGSGVTKLTDVKGKAFAFADPASTSGHLVPSYALRKAGIDPDKDIRPFYTGSHTASFEALRNHKVPAGELNSTAIAGAKLAGMWDPANYLILWQSDPIPNGPIALRGDLDAKFKARLTEVLQTMDISKMPPEDMKFLGRASSRSFAAIDDRAYDGIRDIVSVLHIDLAKMD